MKKNILPGLMAAIALAACAILSGDGPLYLVVFLMALTILVVVHGKRSTAKKMTRWAKANPRKAQGLIAGLELALIGLGITSGYNLRKLGFELSDATAYVFGGLVVLGFLSVPFLPRRRTIAIPKEVNRHRSAYLVIALSSLALMTFTGNRIGDVYPHAAVTRALEAIDRSIFPTPKADPGEKITGRAPRQSDRRAFDGEPGAMPVLAALVIPEKTATGPPVYPEKASPKADLKEQARAEKKANRQANKEFRKDLRRAASAGSCILAVLLIILLLGAVCAGICLMTGALGNAVGVGAVAGGVLIVAGSIWAIIKVARWCKRKPDS